jgi:hypothetical protein
MSACSKGPGRRRVNPLRTGSAFSKEIVLFHRILSYIQLLQAILIGSRARVTEGFDWIRTIHGVGLRESKITWRVWAETTDHSIRTAIDVIGTGLVRHSSEGR